MTVEKIQYQKSPWYKGCNDVTSVHRKAFLLFNYLLNDTLTQLKIWRLKKTFIKEHYKLLIKVLLLFHT